MGNRGIIHDPSTRTRLTRRWQQQAWICCVLSFKDFQHPIMGVSAYTELFFLDEATALAAGHRPCAYCRRRDYNHFKSAWLGANLPDVCHFVSAKTIDKQLHRERVDRSRRQVRFVASEQELPDGVMIQAGADVWLLWRGQRFPWCDTGYGRPINRGLGQVEVLTPRSLVGALNNGYQPQVHSSLIDR